MALVSTVPSALPSALLPYKFAPFCIKHKIRKKTLKTSQKPQKMYTSQSYQPLITSPALSPLTSHRHAQIKRTYSLEEQDQNEADIFEWYKTPVAKSQSCCPHTTCHSISLRRRNVDETVVIAKQPKKPTKFNRLKKKLSRTFSCE